MRMDRKMLSCHLLKCCRHGVRNLAMNNGPDTGRTCAGDLSRKRGHSRVVAFANIAHAVANRCRQLRNNLGEVFEHGFDAETKRRPACGTSALSDQLKRWNAIRRKHQATDESFVDTAFRFSPLDP